ncbi:MAG: thioredoxin-disulfide reductase [Alphaproteobacteria bacterium]|nr:thioredoxin-disulfide reductase [Alphaproteobacteria bacterium]
MTETHKTKVLIIGSGPAGYTAAIYAARANLEPILVTGMDQGGQLMITTDVENYPGFAKPVQGPWLMEQMRLQAEHVGARIINDYVIDIDVSERPFKAKGDSGDVYSGETLIISTGAKARWLGIPSEETYKGRGVSACATCDGFFFRDKDVAIIGGGNSAVEEALFLTNFCNSVTMIHRRDELRAEKIMQKRIFENGKINVLWNKTVEEILGDNSGMTGLKLKDTQSGEISTIDKDGVFVAIGHKPETDLVKDVLDIDKEGYLVTAPDSTATNIPGVFAAGDVADNKYRQAVTAAAMGCMAALEADRFLSIQK